MIEDQYQRVATPALLEHLRYFGHSYLPISRVAESRNYQRPTRRIERELVDEAASRSVLCRTDH